MKSRLQRILSALCILALLAGCLSLTAFAEGEDPVSRAIVVEWSDEDNYEGIRPPSVEVFIGGEPVTLNADNAWTAEKKVAVGSEWTIPDVPGYEKESTGKEVVTVTYSHTPATTTASVKVAWSDNENAAGLRPDSVRISLLADGEVCRTPEDVKESFTWENLPANKKGTTTPIVYTVAPTDALEAYSAAVAGDTITFTLKTASLSLTAAVAGVPEGADVSGLELTVTGPDPKMPVTVKFGDISGTYSIGTVIPGSYVVQENNASDLIEGYVIDPANSKVGDAVYLAAGETGTLEFKYAWKLPEEAEENTDPMAEVGKLSFEIIGPDSRLPMTVTYAQFTDGKFELDDLVPGEYAVIETNPEGLVQAYNLVSDSVTGMVLTVGKDGATAKLFNKYAPAPTPTPDAEVIDIPVTKIWVDDNNKDGNRPASVTVNLYADGVKNDSMEISGPAWTGVFTGKLRYDEEGNEIKYTVNEEPVEWYTATVNGYAITNTYTPEVTSATVTKIWNDHDDEQKMRPTTIAVTLLPTKEVVVLSAANGWTATRNDLPTRINGEEVTYSWVEQRIPGYTPATVVADNVTTFTNTMPEIPKTGNKIVKTGGDHWATFEEYDTALGGQLLINHVGDCFD